MLASECSCGAHPIATSNPLVTTDRHGVSWRETATLSGECRERAIKEERAELGFAGDVGASDLIGMRG